MRNRATLLWTGCIRGGMPCSVSLCTWIPLPSRRSVLFQGMRNRATLLWTGCIRGGMLCSVSLCTWIPLPSHRSRGSARNGKRLADILHCGERSNSPKIESHQRLVLLYKYDIPVGFPPGITSPREDCRSRA